MSDVIKIKRAAPWRRQWCMESSAGTAFDLTGGSVLVRLREKTGGEEVLATVEITDAENGLFSASLTADEMAGLPRVMHLDVIHTDSLDRDAVRDQKTVVFED